MPEAPDLEVIMGFLRQRIVAVRVRSARVIKPSVLRSLCGDLPTDIAGRTIEGIQRRGKFLLIHLSGDRVAAINPMLTGAIQYCSPQERVMKRTCIILSLSNTQELRYLDDRQMGMVYYVDADRLDDVPRLNEQGPDVLDCWQSAQVGQIRTREDYYYEELRGSSLMVLL